LAPVQAESLFSQQDITSTNLSFMRQHIFFVTLAYYTFFHGAVPLLDIKFTSEKLVYPAEDQRE
jgi:hypothetical protein